MTIRKMTKKDWPSVAQIYAEGIATGLATFESEVPDYGSWNASHTDSCRLIAEQEGNVVGWAALSPVSSRCVYGGVGEVSVYVGKDSRGHGIGKLLLQELIIGSEAEGYWTLQSGIFPENEASIKLHEKLGFRFLGKRERIGKTLNGIWKDNLLFERRSKTVGID
ncbi:GNAT family N-acetyltransferase [Allomuricauda sp. SCSIO 65647]|uniref:GNAT family N-acetyltransferase n=1 Tax=Allomuricauda sp. SCSIO 65647 TaxID=2908843 RepID=UPI001F205102|nr:GNAT family N-acetyltransferase [Muricauda sp. SCSIO 65647]UJH68695.1 N-acetyltransferase family protein [Muricauda sp. SCSIO 65647]